jgi:multiple sugar transport system substrate-binding protein
MDEMSTHNMPRQRSSNSPVSRRRFITTAAASSVVALAGCALNSNGGTGNGGGATGGGGSTKLVYWHQEGVPHRAEQFRKYTKRFNEQHDNVQVEVQAQNWGSVFGKLTSALEAGNPPDFMFSLPAFTMTFQSRGVLSDVGDIVSDIKNKHNMFENAIRPFQYDGGTWGVPMWDMVFLNHYRADTLGKTSIWPPKNWKQWLKTVSEVTGGGDYGICLPAAENLWTTENFYNLMINKNAYVYGPEGKIMFNTQETVETLDFYKRMFEQASPPAATSWGWAQWETSLLQGTTHSTTGFSSWMRRLTETKYADNFAANQQPYPKDGQPGSVHYVNDVMVFNEKKKDAIATFLKWLHKKGTYGEWLANTEPTLYLPVTETGRKSDEFWSHDVISRYEESVRTQFDALPKATLYGFRDIHDDLYLPSVGTLESSNVLASIIQELIVNDKTPQEAASWGQNRIEEVLNVGPSSHLNQ